MSQNDFVIDNGTGLAVRQDIESAFQALASNNSGSSTPSTTYAYQFWADTSAGTLKIRNSANNAWIELLQLDGTLTLEDGSASAPALGFRDDLDTGIFSSGANIFNIATSGTERFRVDSSGQVGINDTSPDAELAVAAVSGNAPHIDIGQAGGNRFKLGYEGNNCFLGASSSTGMFVFKNNVTADGHPQADGTEKMRLDNGGRLLVGRTNYITVGGDASDHCFEQITNNGYALTVHSDTANQRGIGVYYPDNSNTAQVAFAFQIGSSFKTIIRDDGDLENANNNYGSISDVSMKENIVDANSQWDDIKNIKIRNYNFKESTGQQTHKQIGVIAQELETVCPNLVDVTRETGKKNVAYSVLYVKAIKALQESMTRIETLEAEVAALKSS